MSGSALCRLSRAVLLSIVLGVLAGCGGGSANVPVSGEVTVGGKPLAKGSLAFKPEGAPLPGGDPSGNIENGKYTLYTNAKPGAPVGKYKVTIVATVEADSTKPNAVKSPVDAKYGDPAKSDLKADVVATPAPGAYDFKLK